ncbi:MAG: hypothetical protein M5U08_26350 [Burkholderiales bacterium]|nr:hypothetical protein [Burkholderiales bacterium]
MLAVQRLRPVQEIGEWQRKQRLDARGARLSVAAGARTPRGFDGRVRQV